MIAKERFWDKLINRIENGKVLPVVGYGVTTMGEDDRLFSEWITEQLAEEFEFDDELPDNASLHDVVCKLIQREGSCSDAYDAIYHILKNHPEPGPTLKHLASIEPFRLFLSTTFDSLLEKAINQVQYPDTERGAHVINYYPESENIDIPGRLNTLNQTTVFHMMGKASPAPEYVVWEDDVLEFVCELNKQLPEMRCLSADLEDSKIHYLLLGLNFSDWLTRFFVRVARNRKFSDRPNNARVDFLADQPGDCLPDSLVMFFNSTRSVQVLPCDPREFVRQLAERWAARVDANSRLPIDSSPSTPAALRQGVPEGAVFISYSSHDREAAVAIARKLQEAGCDVWFDRDQLKTAMNWEIALENAVKNCAVFVSVISNKTEELEEGWFHMERNWAAERAERWPAQKLENFYIPVIIDDDLKNGDIGHEPKVFSRLQRTKLPAGATPEDFATKIAALQKRNRDMKKGA